MTDIFNFLMGNYEIILVAILALLIVGAAIAKGTRNTTDDAVFARLISGVRTLMDLVGKKPEPKPKPEKAS